MTTYLATCHKCGHPLRLDDWDGLPAHVPTDGVCEHCGHVDGYRAEEIALVGAITAVCAHCGQPFHAKIPGTAVDVRQPGGLQPVVPLRCTICGCDADYRREDLHLEGDAAEGPDPLPERRPVAGGMQRP